MAGRDPPLRQLPLDLAHAESRARADFLESGSNRQALALIDAWPDWPSSIMGLWGPAGSGKSHLAAVLVDRAAGTSCQARDLSRDIVPDVLARGVLVLEDIDAGSIDEAALFHLLNLAGEQGAYLLLTSRRPLATIAAGLSLPDLASRLRAVPTVGLDPPDDGLLAAVTLKLLADRQIAPDEDLVAFLLTRIERSVAALAAFVADLDHEALARKRPITRALAAELLRRRPVEDDA